MGIIVKEHNLKSLTAPPLSSEPILPAATTDTAPNCLNHSIRRILTQLEIEEGILSDSAGRRRDRGVA